LVKFGRSVNSARGRHLWRTAGVSLLVLAGVAGVFVFAGRRNRETRALNELSRLWKTGDSMEAYRISSEELEKKPMDFILLTIHGFSAFDLGVSRINAKDTLFYIDACIWSLRKALLTQEGSNDGRVSYVLGKAYYYKGESYADEAVEYLEKSRGKGYTASDIPEYLGLSYAAIGDYEKSVSAFTLALETKKDEALADDLLIALSRSCMELGRDDEAENYLKKCLEGTRDINSVAASRLMLGEIYEKRNEAREAEKQYTDILKEGGDMPEVHQHLGELYSKEGNMAKARYEWRAALRLDPSYLPAIEKLEVR
jgi:tetratricopeptide (TPR) repeat protein